jgi:HEAT repeat protein
VVSKAKQLLLSTDNFFFGEDAGKVLVAWANDSKFVPDLLPLLEQRGDARRRHIAMTILANTRDKRAVIPILRWLLLDTDPTVEALKQMGPIAETDVAVHLRDKDAGARLNAARVLQVIGTPKSNELLRQAAHDSRDISAKEAAQAALDAIKERNPVTRPSTAPAP